MTPWPFVLLGLAVVAVALPDQRVGTRAVAPWAVLFVAAMVAASFTGVAGPVALMAMVALWLLTWGAACAPDRRWRGVLWGVSLVLMLLLSVHRVPGFDNPTLYEQVRLSSGSQPFTQYLNFDKGAAGLLVLAALARQRRAGHVAPASSGVIVVMLPLTALCVLGLAALWGLVAFEPKLPERALAFLAANLLFTCVAEEVFFRGVLQARLAAWLSAWPRSGPVMAVAVSALLFGAVHLHGGLALAALATVAGVGYGWAFARTRRVEAAIGVHFGVNAIHFLLFTYPALQPR